jgi:hypothetical protein
MPAIVLVFVGAGLGGVMRYLVTLGTLRLFGRIRPQKVTTTSLNSISLW